MEERFENLVESIERRLHVSRRAALNLISAVTVIVFLTFCGIGLAIIANRNAAREKATEQPVVATVLSIRQVTFPVNKDIPAVYHVRLRFTENGQMKEELFEVDQPEIMDLPLKEQTIYNVVIYTPNGAHDYRRLRTVTPP